MLRALEKSFSHGIRMTCAPKASATPIVPSVEPVSTTIISSTTARTLAKHRPRDRSSFFTIMQRDIVLMVIS
jgi:hypothetical protein